MVKINEIKGEMKAQCITNQDMAKELGISYYLFRKVLSNEAPFKIDYAYKMSKKLNLSKEKRDAIFFAD